MLQVLRIYRSKEGEAVAPRGRPRRENGGENAEPIPHSEQMFPSLNASYARYLREELEASPHPLIRSMEEVV